MIMIKLNIPMPTSCDSCPFKGARLCYIATWLGTEYKEVPEEGRAEWCPMEDVEDDRWIPVTERLPEKDGHYLVTLFDEIDSWTEPLYWNTTFGGRWQGLIEDDFSDIGNVSAWKPLPEPYTEEEA